MKPTKARLGILALMTIATMVNYLGRSGMSVAKRSATVAVA